MDRGWDELWYSEEDFYSLFDVIDFNVKSQCNEDTKFFWEYNRGEHVY